MFDMIDFEKTEMNREAIAERNRWEKYRSLKLPGNSPAIWRETSDPKLADILGELRTIMILKAHKIICG